MAGIKDISAAFRSKIADAGIEKYAYAVSESTKKEFNTLEKEFTLYRTTFDKDASLTAFLGAKKGQAHGNDLSDEGLAKLAADAKLSAESSPEDPANDIAERQKSETFHIGDIEPDMDKFFECTKKLVETVGKEFKKIKIQTVCTDHKKIHSIYANSNGTEFETYEGLYEVVLEFAGNDGENTTGINFAYVATADLDTPLIEQGDIRTTLENTERSFNPSTIEEKFEGTVIIAPQALGEFVYFIGANFLYGSSIFEGKSIWKDKLGKEVADSRVNMRLVCDDDRLVMLSPYTSDGYRAENVNVIENGVLKSFMMSLYYANKTGMKPTKNLSNAIIFEPGDTPLEDMIKGVKKGLLLGGFSGGEPGSNGEFSGVAKNSFYIENGEIKQAVIGTMVSGNLAEILQNVKSISKEYRNDGTSLLPFLAVEGVTISGS
ncbi:MAG: TldD/PmbA family protein [Lachnospiraceae bacterium]|nr:TldD/PmbA family protein [Lachnospiraceae bacterium]